MTSDTVATQEKKLRPFLAEYPEPGWIHLPELDLYVYPGHSDIIDQVRQELTDQEYKNRTHGLRGTYFKGCTGPLCKKAQRDWGRYQRKQKAEREGRDFAKRSYYGFLDEIDPLLEEMYHIQFIG